MRRRLARHVSVACAAAVGVVAAAWLLGGCTDTPSDIPPCVLPSSACPVDDAGVDASVDASTDADAGAGDGGGGPQDDSTSGSSPDVGPET